MGFQLQYYKRLYCKMSSGTVTNTDFKTECIMADFIATEH